MIYVKSIFLGAIKRKDNTDSCSTAEQTQMRNKGYFPGGSRKTIVFYYRIFIFISKLMYALFLYLITSFFIFTISFLFTDAQTQLSGFCLKGEYEDYTWVMGKTLQTIPFREFQIHLVPMIPYSEIAKTTLVRSLLFIFLPVWKINL